MANFITDDFCEEVKICDPNVIIQECLPPGEDLAWLYTIDLEAPWGYYTDSGPVFPWNNAIDIGQGYADVQYYLTKSVITSDAGIQQEIWVGRANGGNGDDMISGKGLLEWIRDSTPNGTAIAQVNPSVYLGDLIHFDLDGGAGNDRVEGANNADNLSGGSGNDHVIGHGGDDSIEGGSGNDRLYGDSGNDIINGGSGNDYARGGSGNDEIDGGIGNDDLHGDSGNDNLTGGSGYDNLWGGTGDDHILGGDHGDNIYGGSGDDCADGGSGNDTMYMGSGDDLATGGTGNDRMYGESGDDKLDGQDGDDYVDGGSGNDLVVGGDGDDFVRGGSGNDIIRGGKGDDEMWGDEGCDVFAFCEVDFGCRDVIKDFSAGYDPDQIDLSSLSGVDIIRVEETGFDNMVRLDLLAGGNAVQQILVDNQIGANLRSVFSKDTAYGVDDGALVKLGAGMMVDLPSASVISAADSGMFM